MAYNILKDDVEFSGVNLGSIEDIVDNHNDQTISGIKTFSQTVTASQGLSASFLYGDGSALTNLPAAGAVSAYGDAAQYRVVVGGATSTDLSGAIGMDYDGITLSLTGNISASANISGTAFYGNGNNITDLNTANLNLGNGLENSAGNLQVKLDTDSGLALGAGGVSVSSAGLSAKVSLVGADEVLINDAGTNKRATMTSVSNYVDSQINTPVVAGANTQIQYNDGGDLGASSNLTFDSSANVLTTTRITASVHISASTYYGDGSNLQGVGGASTGFITFGANFNVSSSFDIIGVNTSGSSAITGSLLAANQYGTGQRLVFKDIAGSGSTNNIVIEPSGSEAIDGSTAGVKIQVNYGAVTIASDGSSNFFIVSTN